MESLVIQDDQGRTAVHLIAEDYLRYVDKGRRPGKFPPVTAIRDWVRTKGLPERAVYPIGRAIAIKGIEALNIVNPTIDKVEATFLPEYEKELERIVGVVLVNDVFSETNTKGRIIPKTLR